ncbi:lysophospholipid acyltransferase family protein [Flavobacterium sp.]|uniref:lysophospholipid acyltransferase family protein n=1 Tax=Flavobacterium sp. TaxID=239 RepID=UPI002607F301|nr:lysophospholipid acyltransferase family protein [Flavobacterium sp.]MDG2433978.1 lysophospholipid acyltransferase family protein [Flavobacterium sp.]
MQLLLYILVYPLILIISLLPFRLLYLLSDAICFVIYHVARYRRKVVRDNIALALPHLSQEERAVIEKKSYEHMCDMFLEMMKTMSISKKEMEKRMVFKNLEAYLDLEKKGKSIAMMLAHYASYEWVILMNSKITYEGYGIYKKINNVYFDRLVGTIRSKFNTHLIHTSESSAIIEHNSQIGKKAVYGFVSDQSPQSKPKTHWAPFMGVEVPVYTGVEYLSKKLDMAVIYLKVSKVKRGYYEAEFEIIAESTQGIPNYELTDIFLRKVEAQIVAAPEFYLWTHKRWKHMKR